jgi:CheY-like chemotaxis protein
LVEDEFIAALDLQILLYRFGCEVLGPVGSNAEALVLLRHERPQAALLDLQLRDGLALPIAEQLDRMQIPFLLATGRLHQALSSPLLAGAPILSKPVDDRRLHYGLVSLLGLPKTR